MSVKFMLEMTEMQSEKETPNKLRWGKLVDDVDFSIYIPKWRVPEPWPSRICVFVMPRRYETDDSFNLSENDVCEDSTLTYEPIVVTVKKYSEHTRTIRYKPLGEKDTWEIGEPYIPHGFTNDGADLIRLIILWETESRGVF